MKSTPKHRVLVTGAAGAIGRRVCAELTSRGHEVVAFDLIDRASITDAATLQQLAGVKAWHTAPLTDAGTIRRATEGVDTVVHLAGEPHADSDFMTKILPANIIGTYHVFEAAVAAGVKRVVFTSTCQVGTLRTGPNAPEHGGPPLHAVKDVTFPKSLYGASKVFGEAVGQTYAQSHNLNVFSVRVAWMPRSIEECDHLRRAATIITWYLSPRDAARFFALAVEAPMPTDPDAFYTTMYATSRVTPARYELETAKKVIGYEPLDEWPQGTEIYGFKP